MCNDMAAQGEMVRGGLGDYPLPPGMTTIGRAPLNDLVVDEPGVSRQHAAIKGEPKGYWIADLGSRNGTFVNEELLGREPRLLRDNDRIVLGGTKGIFKWIFSGRALTLDMATNERLRESHPGHPSPQQSAPTERL